MDELWDLKEMPFPVKVSLAFGVLGYFTTAALIPRLSPVFVQRGRFGKDLLKANRPIV
jgi:hypothetical protein